MVEMRLYIVADLEGVSGVGGYDLRREKVAGAVGRREKWLDLWVEEVNAAIEGAKEVGAEQIYVLDNHGPGDNIPLAKLAAPAQLIHGGGRPTWMPLLDETLDGLIFIGQHARVGSGGHLCHTYSRQRLRRVRLNKRDIGEIGLVAGIAGKHGVPVVFLSGDDHAVAEVQEWIPGISSATVKRSLSRQTCLSLPREEAHALIRSGVARGLRQRGDIPPTVFSAPLELMVDYRFRDSWRVLVRRCLYPTSGVRMAGWGRLKIVDSDLSRLWDRFLRLV